MQVDSQASPPAGTAPDGASAQPEQVSAPEPAAELPSLADAFAAAPRPAGAQDDPDGQDADQQPQTPGGPDRPRSRLQKATDAVAADYESKLAEERSKWESERTRAEQEKSRADQLEAAQKRDAAEYERTYGSDGEYQRFLGMTSSQINELSWEQSQRRDAVLLARQATRPISERINQEWVGHFSQEIGSAIDLPGVDAEKVAQHGSKSELSQILRHFHAAGAAAKEVELQERITELEGQVKEFRTRAGAGRRLALGGISGSANGNGAPSFEEATPAEMFAYALRHPTAQKE